MRIHLIDGTYELFRNYFGAPKRFSPGGREVGAVVGLLSSLLAFIRQEEVTHIACAFDTVIESFRNRLFPAYKTGEGIESDLLAQFALAEEAVAALGVVVWPMREFEADDALATAAARWSSDPKVEQIILCSADKDLAQCVQGNRVVCLDRRRGQVQDEAGVRQKFGVSPASIPDWLALVGDSADGFPGLPGWGEKSASLVLARYGHLESIPAEADSWGVSIRGAAKLARVLSERRQEAELYRLLATLRRDVPLVEGLEDLYWRNLRADRLESFCHRIGAPGIVRRMREIE